LPPKNAAQRCRKGIPGSRSSGVCTTALATLRRDRFASLDAADAAGAVTTRCIRFQGRYLFVNANVDGGELRAEVLDADGEPIAPFTQDKCIAIREDTTLAQVRWEGADDLSALRGQAVRLRFHLTKGSLYSFWVTPDSSGASYGYVAAGGPGFVNSVDNVGRSSARIGD